MQYRTWYNNGFQRRLVLKIVANDADTRLAGYFTCSTPAMIFMAAWFGFLLLFCCVWTIGIFKNGGGLSGDGPHWMIYQPYGMFLFGVLFLWFGLWLSALTEPKTLAIVEQVVHARVISGDS